MTAGIATSDRPAATGVAPWSGAASSCSPSWRGGARRPLSRRPPARPPTSPSGRREDRGRPWRLEFLVAGLLLATMAAGSASPCSLSSIPTRSSSALTLGGAFAFFGLALAVAGRALVPQVTAVEARPIYDRDAVGPTRSQQRLRDGLEGVTRRRLLARHRRRGAGRARRGRGHAADRAGPGPHRPRWRTPRGGAAGAGRRDGAARRRGSRSRSAVSSPPSREGADPELADLVPRARAGATRPSCACPARRAGWAPRGIVAYSKICTHAGCAVSLFRSPLSPTTESGGPALVCPCHYSTFDVLDGGSVEFGPAGRPLPQLPLTDRRRRPPAGRRSALGAGRAVLVGRRRMSRRRRDPARRPRALRRRAPGRGAARSASCSTTSSPTTGASCSARSRSTRSSCSSLTGTFLALFFDPSTADRLPRPLCAARRAAGLGRLRLGAALSFTVKGGLLMRQTHHWAALVFVAAITLHLLRIVFTGAFRKPRELNYLDRRDAARRRDPRGLLRLLAARRPALGHGAGDRLGGGDVDPARRRPARHRAMGRRVPRLDARSSRACTSSTSSSSRALLAALIGVHLAMIMRQRHTQFPGPGRREDNVVGTPMWPGYALRSLGLFMLVAAVLVLMGGLIQINPIWLWGPYHTYLGTNGAQPDWYLGWLIGALRLMPNLEIRSAVTPSSPTPSSAASCSRRSSSACSTRCRGSTGASSPATTAATTCSTVRATTRGAPRSPRRCSPPSSWSSPPAPPTASSWSSTTAMRARSTSSASRFWSCP